jgi:uncharacterized protein
VRRRVLLAVLVASMGFTAAAAAKIHYRPATFSAHGSVEQVYVMGTRAKAPLALVDRRGARVSSKRADPLGGVLFRGVPSGAGYRVRQGVMQSRALTVMPDRSAPPSTRIYSQRIPGGGYGYLAARDGTKLAIDVRLPGGGARAPYPTLVEYSGYGYADPAGAQSGISQIAQLLGFAVVDVNMRGTGCSGGAFDYFEALQNLDGYDVIETVARQPWVLHHRVGMLGVSYGGISQLFVAATDPPHLAAIAPLSVIDDTAATLYPGGILNTGFALGWAQQRVHDAEPASSTGGEAWAFERIHQGDSTCRSNQVLHGEARNQVARVFANQYSTPAVADPLAPVTFVHKITAPVFLACQWTDGETGAHCPALAAHFTGARRRWFTFTNGVHTDSLDPATFVRWFDFLELYVARRAPRLPAIATAGAPVLYGQLFGTPGVTMPADPIEAEPSYASALAAFQKLPAVRVLFDNGAGTTPGYPVPGFEHSFAGLPVPGTQAPSWYLQLGGTLAATKPARPTSDRFTWSKRARPSTSFTGNSGAGGLWSATPRYDWAQNPPGTAVSYLTGPLRSNGVVIGAGAVDLWIKASVPTVDLQATLSEVRPDGKETFVQDGWLRTSERKLDPAKSTLLAPVPTLRRSDVVPLPRGRWTEVTIPLYYEGHVYRKGSRIRVIVAAPGGDQPVWAFARTVPQDRATVWVAHTPLMPSRLILPVVALRVPTGLPPCPGLRGEPCRSYKPFANLVG